MPKPTLTQLYNLPDILAGDNFYFYIPQPSGLSGVWDNNLSIKCVNTTLAGVSNEKMTIPLYGQQLNYRGRRIQPQSLSATYYEDMTMATWKALKTWFETIVRLEDGFGRQRREYTSTAILEVYNQMGDLINKTVYHQLFPQDLSDVSFDGSSTQPVQVNVTFSYDYTSES